MVRSIARRAVLGGAGALSLSAPWVLRNARAAQQASFPGEEPDDERPIGKMTRSAVPLGALSAVFLDDKGQRVSLEQFRGKPVVLHLWATWCPPCRMELPQVDRVYKELGAAGPLIVPVAVDCGDADKVRAFYAKTGIANLPLYVDAPNAIEKELSQHDHVPEALPTTLILAADGRIAARHLGNMQWDVQGVRQAVATATGTPA